MPYNMSIPGQVSEYQLRAIELVASLVPENGQVVEVGSLFGCSSWAWAKSVHESVTVNCIDPWAGNEGVRSMEKVHGISYGLEQFLEHTKDCPNIVPSRGFSPKDFEAWSKPVDLYYEDAVHTDPVVSQNLNFWSSKLNKHGIICGDDYRPRFPDVRNGVERLAEKFGRELIRVDFFWCLLSSDDPRPEVSAVRVKLKALGIECENAYRAMPPQLSILPDSDIATFEKNSAPKIEFSILNCSIDPMPVENTDLSLSIRCVSPDLTVDGSPKVISEYIQSLDSESLIPDIVVRTLVDFSNLKLEPGKYGLLYDIVTASNEYILHKTVSLRAIKDVEIYSDEPNRQAASDSTVEVLTSSKGRYGLADYWALPASVISEMRIQSGDSQLLYTDRCGDREKLLPEDFQRELQAAIGSDSIADQPLDLVFTRIGESTVGDSSKQLIIRKAFLKYLSVSKLFGDPWRPAFSFISVFHQYLESCPSSAEILIFGEKTSAFVTAYVGIIFPEKNLRITTSSLDDGMLLSLANMACEGSTEYEAVFCFEKISSEGVLSIALFLDNVVGRKGTVCLPYADSSIAWDPVLRKMNALYAKKFRKIVSTETRHVGALTDYAGITIMETVHPSESVIEVNREAS